MKVKGNKLPEKQIDYDEGAKLFFEKYYDNFFIYSGLYIDWFSRASSILKADLSYFAMISIIIHCITHDQRVYVASELNSFTTKPKSEEQLTAENYGIRLLCQFQNRIASKCTQMILPIWESLLQSFFNGRKNEYNANKVSDFAISQVRWTYSGVNLNFDFLRDRIKYKYLLANISQYIPFQLLYSMLKAIIEINPKNEDISIKRNLILERFKDSNQLKLLEDLAEEIKQDCRKSKRTENYGLKYIIWMMKQDEPLPNQVFLLQKLFEKIQIDKELKELQKFANGSIQFTYDGSWKIDSSGNNNNSILLGTTRTYWERAITILENSFNMKGYLTILNLLYQNQIFQCLQSNIDSFYYLRQAKNYHKGIQSLIDNTLTSASTIKHQYLSGTEFFNKRYLNLFIIIENQIFTNEDFNKISTAQIDYENIKNLQMLGREKQIDPKLTYQTSFQEAFKKYLRAIHQRKLTSEKLKDFYFKTKRLFICQQEEPWENHQGVDELLLDMSTIDRVLIDYTYKENKNEFDKENKKKTSIIDTLPEIASKKKEITQIQVLTKINIIEKDSLTQKTEKDSKDKKLKEAIDKIINMEEEKKDKALEAQLQEQKKKEEAKSLEAKLQQQKQQDKLEQQKKVETEVKAMEKRLLEKQQEQQKQKEMQDLQKKLEEEKKKKKKEQEEREKNYLIEQKAIQERMKEEKKQQELQKKLEEEKEKKRKIALELEKKQQEAYEKQRQQELLKMQEEIAEQKKVITQSELLEQQKQQKLREEQTRQKIEQELFQKQIQMQIEKDRHERQKQLEQEQEDLIRERSDEALKIRFNIRNTLDKMKKIMFNITPERLENQLSSFYDKIDKALKIIQPEKDLWQFLRYPYAKIWFEEQYRIRSEIHEQTEVLAKQINERKSVDDTKLRISKLKDELNNVNTEIIPQATLSIARTKKEEKEFKEFYEVLINAAEQLDNQQIDEDELAGLDDIPNSAPRSRRGDEIIEPSQIIFPESNQWQDYEIPIQTRNTLSADQLRQEYLMEEDLYKEIADNDEANELINEYGGRLQCRWQQKLNPSINEKKYRPFCQLSTKDLQMKVNLDRMTYFYNHKNILHNELQARAAGINHQITYPTKQEIAFRPFCRLHTNILADISTGKDQLENYFPVIWDKAYRREDDELSYHRDEDTTERWQLAEQKEIKLDKQLQIYTQNYGAFEKERLKMIHEEYLEQQARLRNQQQINQMAIEEEQEQYNDKNNNNMEIEIEETKHQPQQQKQPMKIANNPDDDPSSSSSESNKNPFPKQQPEIENQPKKKQQQQQQNNNNNQMASKRFHQMSDKAIEQQIKIMLYNSNELSSFNQLPKQHQDFILGQIVQYYKDAVPEGAAVNEDVKQHILEQFRLGKFTNQKDYYFSTLQSDARKEIDTAKMYNQMENQRKAKNKRWDDLIDPANLEQNEKHPNKLYAELSDIAQMHLGKKEIDQQKFQNRLNRPIIDNAELDDIVNEYLENYDDPKDNMGERRIKFQKFLERRKMFNLTNQSGNVIQDFKLYDIVQKIENDPDIVATPAIIDSQKALGVLQEFEKLNLKSSFKLTHINNNVLTKGTIQQTLIPRTHITTKNQNLDIITDAQSNPCEFIDQNTTSSITTYGIVLPFIPNSIFLSISKLNNQDKNDSIQMQYFLYPMNQTIAMNQQKTTIFLDGKHISAFATKLYGDDNERILVKTKTFNLSRYGVKKKFTLSKYIPRLKKIEPYYAQRTDFVIERLYYDLTKGAQLQGAAPTGNEMLQQISREAQQRSSNTSITMKQWGTLIPTSLITLQALQNDPILQEQQGILNMQAQGPVDKTKAGKFVWRKNEIESYLTDKNNHYILGGKNNNFELVDTIQNEATQLIKAMIDAHGLDEFDTDNIQIVDLAKVDTKSAKTNFLYNSDILGWAITNKVSVKDENLLNAMLIYQEIIVQAIELKIEPTMFEKQCCNLWTNCKSISDIINTLTTLNQQYITKSGNATRKLKADHQQAIQANEFLKYSKELDFMDTIGQNTTQTQIDYFMRTVPCVMIVIGHHDPTLQLKTKLSVSYNGQLTINDIGLNSPELEQAWLRQFELQNMMGQLINRIQWFKNSNWEKMLNRQKNKDRKILKKMSQLVDGNKFTNPFNAY